MGPTVGPAVIAGLVSLAVAAITSGATFYVQREKLRQELRTEFMAEQAIVQLLSHPSWNLRKFETIRRHVGGFEADELRRLLVRAGALRFEGDDGSEIWGLRARNVRRLE